MIIHAQFRWLIIFVSLAALDASLSSVPQWRYLIYSCSLLTQQRLQCFIERLQVH